MGSKKRGRAKRRSEESKGRRGWAAVSRKEKKDANKGEGRSVDCQKRGQEEKGSRGEAKIQEGEEKKKKKPSI